MMHLVSTLAGLLPLAQLVHATALLVPLYSNPDPKTCWPQLRASAAAHRELPFILVLNPPSGPVATATNAQIACIPMLRAWMPLVKIVGLVHTLNQAPSVVSQNVVAYSKWASFKVGGAKVPLDGIYFDQIYGNPSTDNMANVTAYSTLARRMFGKNSYVIFNSEAPLSSSFYPLANLIVTVYMTLADFGPYTVGNYSDTPIKQQAMVLYSILPTSGTLPLNIWFVLSPYAPTLGAVYLTAGNDPEVDTASIFGSLFWASFLNELVKPNARKWVGGPIVLPGV